MRTGHSIFLAAITLMAVSVRPLAAAPAGGGAEEEYAQVRKIALKDPKVQEAFEKANERLDAKILQIDPSLRPIVDRERRAPASVAEGTPVASHHFTGAAAATDREHVVVKGETLTSIAAHYKVRLVTLEKVNHITDARTLRVGQRLIIPAQTRVAAQPSPSASIENEPAKPASATQDSQPKDGEGLWDKVKNSL